MRGDGLPGRSGREVMGSGREVMGSGREVMGSVGVER